jgi:hypothetical protein
MNFSSYYKDFGINYVEWNLDYLIKTGIITDKSINTDIHVSPFRRLYKKTFLDHIYDIDLENTIIYSLNISQNRKNNIYSDIYSFVYITYIKSKIFDPYNDFDQIYDMNEDEFNNYINKNKNEMNEITYSHYKQIREIKEYYNIDSKNINSKETLRTDKLHIHKIDLDKHGYERIYIRGLSLGTHFISQDGEFRPISIPYNNLLKINNHKIYKKAHELLKDRFKNEVISIDSTINSDLKLLKNNQKLEEKIKQVCFDHNIWYDCYVMTWLISIKKFLRETTDNHYNFTFFMSFMINKEEEKKIYDQCIENIENIYIDDFKRDIKNVEILLPTNTGRKIYMRSGQKTMGITIKEMINIVNNDFYYPQITGLREFAIVKLLEPLMFTKKIFNFPLIYNYFISCYDHSIILDNEHQIKKNKISTSFKAINELLNSAYNLIQNEKIENFMKEYINNDFNDLLKYNNSYIYIDNFYFTFIEEYQNKTFGNIDKMINKQFHKNFFENDKFFRYMFEILNIAYHFGNHGIIHGDLHLNNACIALNNMFKDYPKSDVVTENICYIIENESTLSLYIFPYDSSYVSYIDFSRAIVNDKHMETLCKNSFGQEFNFYSKHEREKMIKYFSINFRDFYQNNKEIINNAFKLHFNKLFHIFAYIDSYSIISKFKNLLLILKINISKDALALMDKILTKVIEYLTTNLLNEINILNNLLQNKKNYDKYQADKSFINKISEELFIDYKADSKKNMIQNYNASSSKSIDIWGGNVIDKNDSLLVSKLRPIKTEYDILTDAHKYLCTKQFFLKKYKFEYEKLNLKNILKEEIKYINILNHLYSDNKFDKTVYGAMEDTYYYDPILEIEHSSILKKNIEKFISFIYSKISIRNNTKTTKYIHSCISRFLIFHISYNKCISELHIAELYKFTHIEYDQLFSLLILNIPDIKKCLNKDDINQFLEELINDLNTLKMRNVFDRNRLKWSNNNDKTIISIDNERVIYSYSLNMRFKKYLSKRINDHLYYKIIFCIIKRYNSIFGHELDTMSLSADKLIYNKHEIDIECFGSIFNRHLNNYYSLFPDLEKIFGASGSYFELDIEHIKKNDYNKDKKLSISYNPPYDEYFIYYSFKHLLTLLDEMDKENIEYKIYGTLPNWESNEKYGEYKVLSLMNNIEKLSKKIVDIEYKDYIKNTEYKIGKTSTIYFEIN